MLNSSAIDGFRQELTGKLLEPGDKGYDESRSVWNGMIDRRPALIAQPAGVEDVVLSVGFAKEHDLPLTIKGGGHQVAGKAICDDGLVIDFATMRSVHVDPAAKVAHVQPGATWGDLDNATQEHGLATTGGVDSRTGVAGLTLGGGNGYLARAHGLTVDNLISAEVVTAAGEVVQASDDEHPDLFWALRGGGGSFGVVTSFEFQLHEVGPEVLVAQNFQPFENGAETLRFYRDFMVDAPDDVACLALIVHVPPVEPFPEEFHGKNTVALVAFYSGDVDSGRPYLKRIGEFGDPILAFSQPMSYTALQSSFDAGTPDGMRYYYKTQFLSGLSNESIETIIDNTDPLPGPITIIGIEPMGGAINRVDPTATSFPHRNAAYNFGIWAGWADPDEDEQMIAWARSFHAAMVPYSTGGIYMNYLDRDDATDFDAAYGGNYQRLQAIKSRYDPDNLFGAHKIVVPATTTQ